MSDLKDYWTRPTKQDDGTLRDYWSEAQNNTAPPVRMDREPRYYIRLDPQYREEAERAALADGWSPADLSFDQR